MKLKQRLISIITLLILSVAGVLYSTHSLVNEVNELNNNWHSKNALVVEKKQLLFKITHHFGYGGFIHHFKNIILRDESYLPAAVEQMEQTKLALRQYKNLISSESERIAIESFEQTLNAYNDKLLQLRELKAKDNLSIKQVDRLLQVDDSDAFRALELMANEIEEINEYALQMAEQNFLNVKKSSFWHLAFIIPLLVILALVFARYVIRLSSSYNALKTIFNVTPDALIVLNEQGKIWRINDKAQQMFGYTREEFVKLNVESLIPSEFRIGHDILRQKFISQSASRELASQHAEVMALRKNGEEFPVAIALNTFDQHHQKATIAVLQDLSLFKGLERLSTTDHLTQISNRLHLDSVIEKEFHRAQRYGTDLSIIICDIDHFKKVNDRFGHLAGDKVLQQFAMLIKNRIRETDFCGRWGGEEFCIVCPNTNMDEAYQLANNLRKMIEHNEFSEVGNITSSFGLSQYKGENDDIHSIITRADMALYKVKNQGRNKVVIG